MLVFKKNQNVIQIQVLSRWQLSTTERITALALWRGRNEKGSATILGDF